MLDFANPAWVRRRHGTPEAAAVAHQCPTRARRKHLRFRFVIDRPDRLGRSAEGRIGGIDFDLCQQRRDLALGQFVRQRLLDEVADHALAFGAEHIERV